MPFDATSELADDVLLIRYANGDAAAARVLTARLTPVVLAHAARLLGSQAEAEDVAQEAMLRLWRQGALDMESMITSRRPLAEVNEGFADLEASKGIRTVIEI